MVNMLGETVYIFDQSGKLNQGHVTGVYLTSSGDITASILVGNETIERDLNVVFSDLDEVSRYIENIRSGEDI